MIVCYFVPFFAKCFYMYAHVFLPDSLVKRDVCAHFKTEKTKSQKG